MPQRRFHRGDQIRIRRDGVQNAERGHFIRYSHRGKAKVVSNRSVPKGYEHLPLAWIEPWKRERKLGRTRHDEI